MGSFKMKITSRVSDDDGNSFRYIGQNKVAKLASSMKMASRIGTRIIRTSGKLSYAEFASISSPMPSNGRGHFATIRKSSLRRCIMCRSRDTYRVIFSVRFWTMFGTSPGAD